MDACNLQAKRDHASIGERVMKLVADAAGQVDHKHANQVYTHAYIHSDQVYMCTCTSTDQIYTHAYTHADQIYAYVGAHAF